MSGPFKKVDDTLFDFSARTETHFKPVVKMPLNNTALDAKRFVMVMENRKTNLVELIGDQAELIGVQFQRSFDIFEGTNEPDQSTKLRKSKKLHRSYKLLAVEQSMQDAYFEVTDLYGVAIKQQFISRFYLFPRLSLPTYEKLNKAYRIVLPTGEELSFDFIHSVLLPTQIFEEKPIARFRAGFPQIEYVGRGEVVRVDRQAHQYLYQASVIYYDLKKFVACKLHGKDLFTPPPIEYFKFTTDDQFKKYLSVACPQQVD